MVSFNKSLNEVDVGRSGGSASVNDDTFSLDGERTGVDDDDGYEYAGMDKGVGAWLVYGAEAWVDRGAGDWVEEGVDEEEGVDIDTETEIGVGETERGEILG